MKQTTLSQNDSPLLNFAISRLDPEVFSHPVWVRFGKTDISASLQIVDDLLSAAKNLQDEDLSSACQVLLICAVYQNHAGQHHKALRTTQQALSLTEHTGLARETVWAIWGACAMYIQQGNYEQASNHFVDLHAALSKQNEWVLADFVDIVKGSLIQNPPVNEAKHSGVEERPSGDLLASAFDWLLQWGFSTQHTASEFETISKYPVSHTPTSTLTQSFFSVQRWQGHWHTLMLMFKSELKLQWAKNDSLPPRGQSSFWGTILSPLRLYLSGRNMDTQVINDVPQTAGISTLPPIRDSHSSNTKSRKPKKASSNKKVDIKQLSRPATTAMPVEVHMLGAFNLMIGDSAVKLAASRGLSLFKYLLLHHKQTIPREVLMDVFWPDAEPATARNNLNVAMHTLRKALRTVIFLPVIVFEDGAYGLEPNLLVWLDVEEFERCVKSGQRLESRNQLTSAVTEYESAISLYQGDFLEQNPYEEWTILDRERLRIAYIDTLDRLSQIYFDQERYAACITVGQLILTRDRCREDAHCILMRCYSRQGQYHLALRQYQICVEALRAELKVEPALETIQLYDRIRRRERL